MEQAYKGMMGGYSVLKDGDEKHIATHVVLTVEEYNDLRRNIASLKLQLSNEKAAHKKDVDNIKKQAIAYKQKAAADAQAVKEASEASVQLAEAERDRQTNLNRNLLRITRERANAKRGLQPKRKHCGYRFSSKIMQVKTIAGHDKKTGAIYADVWSATLETPYDGTIPIHQIEDHIFADLIGDSGILSKLYVHYWVIEGDSSRLWKGTYADAMAENPEGKNYLFDYKFMVNPKSGLWEIQITTTKSIRALSDMMRPRERERDR